MDLVSTFFENILTVEGDALPVLKATSASNVQLSHASEPTSLSPPKVPKGRDSFDFSFWGKKDKDNDKEKDKDKDGGTAKDEKVSASQSFYNMVQGVSGGGGLSAITGGTSTSSALLGNILTDKLMEKIISMVLPLNLSTSEGQVILKERIAMQKTRPSLSVNTMSTNSIQLNQRLSVVFQLLDQTIRFFGWHNPAFTLALLLVVTHVILNPILLTVLPLGYILFNVMVPHYLIVYPPDKSTLQVNPVPSMYKLEQPITPLPIPEFSREFILNLTDLQNYMLLYVVGFDFFTWLTRDYLYFKDEDILSITFLVIFVIMINNLMILPKVLPILMKVLPIKLMMISGVWIATILFHPYFRNRILEWFYDEDTRLWWVTKSDEIEKKIRKALGLPTEEKEIENDEQMQEIREVEIFELQRLDMKTKCWERVGYSPDFYTVNNPYRILSESVFEEEIEKLEEEGENDEEAAETSVSDVNVLDIGGVSTAKSGALSDVKPKEPSLYNTTLEDITQDSIEIGAVHDTQSLDDSIERDYKIPHTKYIDSIRAPIDWEFGPFTWKIDLDSSGWVLQNFIQDVVTVDTDEKWVYDVFSPDYMEEQNKVEEDTINTSTNANTNTNTNTATINNNINNNNVHEIFRRRRWIRKCVRQSHLTKETLKDPKYDEKTKGSTQTFSNYLI